jgi:hypothetical protein
MTKSWRDVLPIHPAAELFPLMSPDELRTLGEDIKKNELRVPIILWSESENTEPVLLDGRNRLDAAELAGIKVFEVRRDKGGRIDLYVPSRRLYGSGGGRSAIDGSSLTADPYEFVLSANIHRRHLTAEQKRELIAKLLKADPAKSNRQIATMVDASHPHVAKVRAELEKTGDVETVTTSIDSKGRKQRAKRQKPNYHEPIDADEAERFLKRAERRERKKPGSVAGQVAELTEGWKLVTSKAQVEFLRGLPRKLLAQVPEVLAEAERRR